MTILLAGDIGGTKADIHLVESQPGDSPGPPLHTILHKDRFICRKFSNLTSLVQDFLGAAREKLQKQYTPPVKACFAVAGPVTNNSCKMTNLKWMLDGEGLSRELQIPKVSLINDFTAVGFGISNLEEEDIETLQAGEPQFGSPMAIIGAGTGLGEAFLLQDKDSNYHPYATEGSHADFAAQTEEEYRLKEYIMKNLPDLQHVSVERIVSGPGMIMIYQFLRDDKGYEELEDIRTAVTAWQDATEKERHEKELPDPAPLIARAALNPGQTNTLCSKTMEIFIKVYGAEAGNLALTILPYAGLYIAGGISPQILETKQQKLFLDAFNNKGRMQPLLEKIPVHLIKNNKVGVLGATVHADNLG